MIDYINSVRHKCKSAKNYSEVEHLISHNGFTAIKMFKQIISTETHIHSHKLINSIASELVFKQKRFVPHHLFIDNTFPFHYFYYKHNEKYLNYFVETKQNILALLDNNDNTIDLQNRNHPLHKALLINYYLYCQDIYEDTVELRSVIEDIKNADSLINHADVNHLDFIKLIDKSFDEDRIKFLVGEILETEHINTFDIDNDVISSLLNKLILDTKYHNTFVCNDELKGYQIEDLVLQMFETSNNIDLFNSLIEQKILNSNYKVFQCYNIDFTSDFRFTGIIGHFNEIDKQIFIRETNKLSKSFVNKVRGSEFDFNSLIEDLKLIEEDKIIKLNDKVYLITSDIQLSKQKLYENKFNKSDSSENHRINDLINQYDKHRSLIERIKNNFLFDDDVPFICKCNDRKMKPYTKPQYFLNLIDMLLTVDYSDINPLINEYYYNDYENYDVITLFEESDIELENAENEALRQIDELLNTGQTKTSNGSLISI